MCYWPNSLSTVVATPGWGTDSVTLSSSQDEVATLPTGKDSWSAVFLVHSDPTVKSTGPAADPSCLNVPCAFPELFKFSSFVSLPKMCSTGFWKHQSRFRPFCRPLIIGLWAIADNFIKTFQYTAV